jgi:hypothetical protein
MSVRPLLQELQNIRDTKENLSAYLTRATNTNRIVEILNDLDQEVEKVYFKLMMHYWFTSDLIFDKYCKTEGQLRIDFYEQNKTSEEDRSKLLSIVSKYIDNNMPVLELFPGLGEFTNGVLSADPLYIVDWDNTILDIVSKQFNEFYSEKRLMRYTCKVVDKKIDFVNLPKNTMGLVFCFNGFTHGTTEFLQDTSDKVMGLLAPGGHFVFNFLPHDRDYSIKLVDESRAFSIVDHNKLDQHFKENGWEVVQKIIGHNRASTYVLKKPGDFNSPKITPMLPQIIEPA